MDRFDRLIIAILAVLTLAIVAVILSAHWIGLPLPEIPGTSGSEIGVYGPFRLKFTNPMDADSVAERLSISPTVTGRLRWEGEVLEFYPDQPLLAGKEYTLNLQPGARSLDRREVNQSVQVIFSIRQPRVTLLKPILAQPEIWLSDITKGSVSRLTDTGGDIFDYNTHPNGEYVVYSYPNELNGIDLWLLKIQTLKPEKVLDCGINWCIYPSISPNGDFIAFSQRDRVDQDSQPGFPKVYLLDLRDGSAARLFDDPQITGFDPLWSPDGTKLAFFDGSISAIRVYDFLTDSSVQLPSQMGRVGSWSPDGNRLIYNDLQFAGGLGKVIVYIANLQAEDITQVLDNDPSLEFTNPLWSPDGQWIASGARYLNSGNDQQLVLIDAQNYEVTWITQDSTYTHSSHQWSPASDSLVYQRFRLGSSEFTPEIWLWDLQTGETKLLSDEAGLPRWLP